MSLQLRYAALMLAVLGAAGCAATGAQSKRASAPLPGTEACFWLSSLRGWDVIDQTTMIVYAPLPKDAYLIKLFEPVPDLDFHERIGFDDGNHDGRICSLGDDVLVRDVGPRRIPITAVRALTADQVKQLKATAKAGAQPTQTK